MKKISLLSLGFLLSFTLLASNAFAGKNCKKALKNATEKAAKDKKCQNEAKNVFKALHVQIKKCKGFRLQKKACRKAKQQANKICKKTKHSCKKICKKGAKGKSCRKNCRKKKRLCKKRISQVKRACKRAVKASAKFSKCKSAQKITGKASKTTLFCAGKYYVPAIGICIVEAFLKK